MVEIEVIEKTFFDRKEGAGRSVDLGAITQKWLTAAEF
jgi:hypothetical protein